MAHEQEYMNSHGRVALNAAQDDDCWDAFGSDDDEEEESLCEQGVLWLTRHLLRWNPQIPLSQRRVVAENEDWMAALQARGIAIVASSELCDAAIVENETSQSQIRRNVVPGGVLMTMSASASLSLDDRVWSETQAVGDNVVAVIKHPCPINEASCPWLSSSHSVTEERRLLALATVSRSAYELASNETKLTEHDLHRASQCLQNHGYCIIRNLVDPNKCLEWGKAVLQDLDEAATLLLEREGVDLRNAGNVQHNYRELAMREDLRVDLRDGPHLRALREEEHQHYAEWGMPADSNPSAPVITSATGRYDSCLRFHPDILEIVRRTMNPKDSTLYKGNFGRYNFDGSGPDGSYQPLRIGPMGGIVSLPGSADQALHADTPHLFEHCDCLPAHYINAFCLGVDVRVECDSDGSPTGSTPVGGTVFVHDSHRLSFTSELEAMGEVGMSEQTEMAKQLVRPSLELGDVVLFDCRLLHFGLANNKDVERPLLYTNMTHAWFHDPKNWEDRQRIFDYDS